MIRTFKNLIPMGVVACLAVIGASNANATLTGSTPLAPGGFVLSTDVSGNAPGTLIADQIIAYSITTSGPQTYSGTLESAVYREAGGTLDFYYQINNTSPDANENMETSTVSNFGGFLTDVGYRLDGSSLGGSFSNSTFAPGLTTRNGGPGTTVSFHWGDVLAPSVPPGSSSAVYVVMTNATDWKIGTAASIDSGTATVLGYQPTSAVPEPTSIVMLGSALLGLAALGRRRFAR